MGNYSTNKPAYVMGIAIMEGAKYNIAEIMNLLFEGKRVTVGNFAYYGGPLAESNAGVTNLLGALRAAKSRTTRQLSAIGMMFGEADLVLRHCVQEVVAADFSEHRSFSVTVWLEPKDRQKYTILSVNDNPALK